MLWALVIEFPSSVNSASTGKPNLDEAASINEIKQAVYELIGTKIKILNREEKKRDK